MVFFGWIGRVLRREAAGKSAKATDGPIDFSIPISPDRTLDELVDFILELQNDTRLDALCAYTSMHFEISGEHAALAWDRVQEGIERAKSGDPNAVPNQKADPVAWISYHRALADDKITLAPPIA